MTTTHLSKLLGGLFWVHVAACQTVIPVADGLSADTNTAADTNTISSTGSSIYFDTDTDTDTDTDSYTGTESNSDRDTRIDTPTDSDTNSDTISDSENEHGSDTHVDSGIDPNLALVDWLVQYIPLTYPRVEVTEQEADDDAIWYQATIEPDAENVLQISWWQGNEAHFLLGTVRGLYEEKPLFIGTDTDNGWRDAEYTEGIGYYVPSYMSATMSDWNIGGMTVVQFDGNPEEFVNAMLKARKPI